MSFIRKYRVAGKTYLAEVESCRVKYNPVRPSELGGARCRCSSDYEAVILKPQQTFSILNSLPLLQQTMVVLDAATGLRYSEIAGLKWQDVDWENNQIHVRRRWIRGNVSEPKSRKSQAPVAMAPLLAKYLRAWQLQTAYWKATDWMFASEKTHGRTPRVGNMLCVDYLRSCCNQGAGAARKGPSVWVPQPAPQPGIVPCHQEEDRRQNGAAQHAACEEQYDARSLRPDGYG